MRNLIVLLAALLLCAVSVTASHAQEGKNVFMVKCGSCHRTGGEATVFAPSKYAAIQWERFFTKDKHTAVKNIKDQISQADVAAVQKYLVEHAADSEQPEAVGLK